MGKVLKKNNIEIEQYRDLKYSNKSDGNNGVFVVPYGSYKLFVICSDGGGWDHVSVSLKNRVPNWHEMNKIKELFFDDEETCVQFHPKKSEYINNCEMCLHIWKKQNNEYQLPPSLMVGLR